MSVRRTTGSARSGYAAAAGAAVLWAAGGVVARHVIADGASYVELTEARAWISAAVLVGALGIRPPADDDAAARPPLYLVVLFGLSIAMANLLYYASLSKLPVAVAITVQYTGPALVVLWTVVVDRYRPSRRVVGALVLAVAGVAFLAELPVVLGEARLRLSGVGFVFAVGSAFAFATYIVTGERLTRRIGARRVVARGFVVASVLWIIVQAGRGRPGTLLQARFTPWIVFLAVATTIVPFFMFVWGLERIHASNAAIVSTLEPLTAAVIAFVWLGETLSGLQVAGALMVLAGVAAVQTERPPSDDVLVERAAVGE